MRFTPKPRPTTDSCRSLLVHFLVSSGKGFPQARAKTTPASSAMPEETKGASVRSATAAKSSFFMPLELEIQSQVMGEPGERPATLERHVGEVEFTHAH